MKDLHLMTLRQQRYISTIETNDHPDLHRWKEHERDLALTTFLDELWEKFTPEERSDIEEYLDARYP